jgi:hypothetical protein
MKITKRQLRRSKTIQEKTKMKISKRQLKRIIKEEKQKLLKEQWNNAEPLSPLVQFAQAWAGLGGAVSSQILDLSNAHIEGRIEDAAYEMNPNALDLAFQRLQQPLSALSRDGDENAAELMDALEAAAEIFAEGDEEIADDR